MSESSDKRRNMYIYYPKGNSKPPCLVHGPSYSSDERKVLGDFGYNCVRSRPNKDHVSDPSSRNKFNRHQDNHYILNSSVDEILL